MAADKTIWECPVYTLSSQLDGAQRLIIQGSSDALNDYGVPLSLLAEWLFANNQIGLYSGSSNPDNALGTNGDLYLQSGTQIKQKIGGTWSLKWTIAGSGADPIDITIPIADPMPYFVDVATYPGITKNSEVICRTAITGGKRRWQDMQVDEVFDGLTFIGFNIYGHPDDSGNFDEAVFITIKQ